MIVIRNCFIAKPGNASKLAAQIKEAGTAAGIPSFRVLTDITGDFNRVVLEYEAADIGEFDTHMKEYQSNSILRELKGYTELWVTGSREIMQVV